WTLPRLCCRPPQPAFPDSLFADHLDEAFGVARLSTMRFALPALVALSLAAAACGPGRPRFGHPAHHAERATRPDVAVSDDQFPNAVRDLLASEPQSKERQQRLAGVVARQMTRVSGRFRA